MIINVFLLTWTDPVIKIWDQISDKNGNLKRA